MTMIIKKTHPDKSTSFVDKKVDKGEPTVFTIIMV